MLAMEVLDNCPHDRVSRGGPSQPWQQTAVVLNDGWALKLLKLNPDYHPTRLTASHGPLQIQDMPVRRRESGQCSWLDPPLHAG